VSLPAGLDVVLDLGFGVFPCRARTTDDRHRAKAPLTRHGKDDATADRRQIEEWARQFERPAWGARPPSGTTVLDIDTKHQDGFATLKDLERGYGALPPTLTSRTPSKGQHRIFSTNADYRNRVGVRPGLDVRGADGYIVVPPSEIETGRYEWLDAGAAVAAAPDWLVAEVFDYRGPRHRREAPAAIPEGTRNDTLFREACDLRRAGATEDEALARLLARNAADGRPPLPETEVQRIVGSAWRYPENFFCNDLGNAQRLLQLRGQDIRFAIEADEFFVWDSVRWLRDERDLAVEQLMKQANRTIWEEARAQAEPEKQKRLGQWAVQSQNTPRLRAAVQSIKSEPGVAMRLGDFDQDPLLLGVRNGTLDLRDGALRTARRDDHISRTAGCAFDEGAECPLWLAFLDRVFPDAAVRGYVQRLAGYSLTGEIREHVLVFCHGLGRNGKTVLLETLMRVLHDYGSSLRTDVLMARSGSKGGPSEDEARLLGKRFVTANETQEGMRFNEALVKDITGGDTVTARRLYENSFDYRPQFKLWVRGNHKPIFHGDDGGMTRRIRLVPFAVHIPDGEQDTGLQQKLGGELPGILNWAVEGCLEWQRTGLAEPEPVLRATGEYTASMDTLGGFLDECIELVSTESARELGETRIASSELYRAYEHWCEGSGCRPLSRARFVQKLEERGLRRFREMDRRGFEGVKLRKEVGAVPTRKF
jgi:putative DNA primase/helicase